MEAPNYHLVQRIVGRWETWRPLVGIAVMLILFFVVAPLVVIYGAAFGYGLTGDDVTSTVIRLASTDDVTPSSLAVLNIALGSAIASVALVAYVVNGMRLGWISSVIGRLRWKWMAVTFGLAFVALLATVVVGSFVPAAGDPADSSGGLNNWTDTTRDFVIVIVLLTPLQAAGEEYAFRGYLTQAFGGLFRNRVAAVLIPAVLFALAHGAQDAPVFVDRLAFGIVAGILVIATGGLEAGIAMHVLNNFLAYGFALAFSDMTTALNPTGGSWWTLPTTLTQSLVYLALAIWAARRTGLARAVDRGSTRSVLEGSEPRV
jgi:membrane protease YdiL (CAAX protease family)